MSRRTKYSDWRKELRGVNLVGSDIRGTDVQQNGHKVFLAPIAEVFSSKFWGDDVEKDPEYSKFGIHKIPDEDRWIAGHNGKAINGIGNDFIDVDNDRKNALFEATECPEICLPKISDDEEPEMIICGYGAFSLISEMPIETQGDILKWCWERYGSVCPDMFPGEGFVKEPVFPIEVITVSARGIERGTRIVKKRNNDKRIARALKRSTRAQKKLPVANKKNSVKRSRETVRHNGFDNLVKKTEHDTFLYEIKKIKERRQAVPGKKNKIVVTRV